MQTQNWRFLNQPIAIVSLLLTSFSISAVAQREDANAIFASAPKVSTRIDGVRIFAAPPKGFNPVAATNVELLTYGLPQRPDAAADPKGYGVWERAMLALKTHVTNVEAKPYTSREMMPTGAVETANVDGTTSVGSYNWSGIGNTNKNTQWNAKTSFTTVYSVWSVPVASPPFGGVPCSDGPWWEVTWNGIDGSGSGDVVQGGSSSYWDGGGCNGAIQYYGWVEWYPSYPILALYCGASLCPVNSGDDFFVVTYASPGTSNQNVFVEDVTQQWSGTINLAWKSGPGVVGNIAEYIVERPCCYNGNNFPLSNYVYQFFSYSSAFDGANKQFFPGTSSSSTDIFTMYADDGSTPISQPVYYGTAGNSGKYSIWWENENCAYVGGCAP